jgi:hypothetical protein
MECDEAIRDARDTVHEVACAIDREDLHDRDIAGHTAAKRLDGLREQLLEERAVERNSGWDTGWGCADPAGMTPGGR